MYNSIIIIKIINVDLKVVKTAKYHQYVVKIE